MIQGANFPEASSDLYVQVALCGNDAINVPSGGFTFGVDVLFQSSGLKFGDVDDGTGTGSPYVLMESDMTPSSGYSFSEIINGATAGAPQAIGQWYTSWVISGVTTTTGSIATIDIRFAPQASWYGNILLDNIYLK
jgi:hypothetical protein